MTAQAEACWSRRDQLYAGNIFVDANFMTGITAQGNGRMDEFPFGHVFMTGRTLGEIGVLAQGNGVHVEANGGSPDQHQRYRHPGRDTQPSRAG